MDLQKCFLIAFNITTNLFAKFAGITKSIQVIILHLECKSQFSAKLIQQMLIAFTGTTQNRSHL